MSSMVWKGTTKLDGNRRRPIYQLWILCLYFTIVMCIPIESSETNSRCKVRLRYDPPTKSSVTLRWKIDCPHQDDIITGYNISYCPIAYDSIQCEPSFENKYVFINYNPKQTEVTIKNLYAFQTYKFTFAIIDIQGQNNIANASVVITTPEDTPTAPRNVQISDVTNDSLVISWDPPLHRNGIIGKYIVWNNDQKIYEDKVPVANTSNRQITLRGLQASTNYSLSVQACNIIIGLCSKRGQNDNILVRTKEISG